VETNDNRKNRNPNTLSPHHRANVRGLEASTFARLAWRAGTDQVVKKTYASGQDHHPDARLVPLLAMIERLPQDARAEIGRALHAKLNAPPTAAERRVKDLRFLAQLLDERPQHPEGLPYIPRTLYDERRGLDPSAAPPSARLQERFGSWQRACHAAWGLLEDGRSWGPGQAWPRVPRRGKNYELGEAIRSVQACAEALGHIPASSEYHAWVVNRRAHARQRGETSRLVHYATVLRLLAPDRTGGNGWRLAISRVPGASPPG
jgi:hypothetical protein